MNVATETTRQHAPAAVAAGCILQVGIGTVCRSVAICNHSLCVPHRPYDAQNCSIARALEVVGERWSLLVMRDVLLGARHFAEIRRSLGVAPNILSDRLATLVEHGLLERRGAGVRPDRARASTSTP